MTMKGGKDSRERRERGGEGEGEGEGEGTADDEHFLVNERELFRRPRDRRVPEDGAQGRSCAEGKSSSVDPVDVEGLERHASLIHRHVLRACAECLRRKQAPHGVADRESAAAAADLDHGARELEARHEDGACARRGAARRLHVHVVQRHGVDSDEDLPCVRGGHGQLLRELQRLRGGPVEASCTLHELWFGQPPVWSSDWSESSGRRRETLS
eukprot:3388956-Rhodomonas_salina.2